MNIQISYLIDKLLLLCESRTQLSLPAYIFVFNICIHLCCLLKFSQCINDDGSAPRPAKQVVYSVINSMFPSFHFQTAPSKSPSGPLYASVLIFWNKATRIHRQVTWSMCKIIKALIARAATGFTLYSSIGVANIIYLGLGPLGVSFCHSLWENLHVSFSYVFHCLFVSFFLFQFRNWSWAYQTLIVFQLRIVTHIPPENAAKLFFTNLRLKSGLTRSTLFQGETHRSEPTSFGWLVVEPTRLKHTSQSGTLPQIWVKIKHIWKHHLVGFQQSFFWRDVNLGGKSQS